MFFKTVLVALCVAGVFAQLELDGTVKDQLKIKLREQCQRVGAEDKTDSVASAVESFVNCGKTLVNVTELKNEIEQAKPNGALDEVFKKYCAKTPQLKTCIHSLLDGVSPCLDASSNQHLGTGKNGTDQLIDFVCYKDGDRIALFIAEGGPECFQSKSGDIRECYENIKNTVSSEQLQAMTISQRCQKYDELTTCIVQKLETCDTPTPANMAESLFKYVRKSSPCNTALPLLN